MIPSERIATPSAPTTRATARLVFKTEISDAISGIVDRDHFLQRLARRVVEVTGNPAVAIYTRAGQGGDLLLRSSTIPKSRPVPARVSVAASVANPASFAAGDGVGDVLAVPIGHGEETMGALVLYAPAGAAFGAGERLILADIAEEIAPAIAVAEHHHTVKQSSVIDLRTGAYASWYVNQRLDEEFARAQRTQSPITVILVCLLNFDDIQQEHGYDVADTILRELVTEYAGLTRVFDIVGARGRSELAILLPDTDIGQAAPAIARIHHRSTRVFERLELAPSATPLRVITGAASFPADGDQPTSILVAAEHRLNQNEILQRRMQERG